MSGALDSLGMLDAALGLADHVADAAGAAAQPSLSAGMRDASSVVLAASGDDLTAARAAAALASASCRVPIVVPDGADLPGFVGAGSLVVASSWSGGDAGTLAVARDAVARGAELVAVGGGGALEALAAEQGAPFLRVGDGLPAARAAVAPGTAALLSVLAQLGMADPAVADVGAATAQLRRRAELLAAPADPAARLARSIGRTLPIVYGAGPLGALAAAHWKSRCNTDPKVPAFANSVPALTHDEVAGWAQHGDVTRQVFSVVLLRHDHEHAEHATAMDRVGEMCEEVVAGVHEVRAAGEGPLAQLLDLLLVGDVTALRMDALAGVDPGPVPTVEDLTTG